MVYTNLSSEVHIKSHIGCGSDKFFDPTKVTDDINIVVNTINFNETGLNKSVNVKRIFGDSVVTTITNPTHIDLDLSFIVDSDVIEDDTKISDILHNFGDYESIGDYNGYSEDDKQRRHRIALVWSDGTEQFMKTYYNAYLVSLLVSNPNTLSITAKFRVPIKDIETGKANYYEYEGDDASGTLETIDTAMTW